MTEETTPEPTPEPTPTAPEPTPTAPEPTPTAPETEEQTHQRGFKDAYQKATTHHLTDK